MAVRIRSFIFCAIAVLLFRVSAVVHALEIIEGEVDNSCAICHGELNTQHEDGIHFRFGITCADCHGGDSTDDTKKAMSPESGFVGRISATAIPAFCDKCHGDYSRMRQYGIPIDQYDRFKTSAHGKALLEKADPNSANCTSCHGVHDTKKVSDPRSRVYPLNLTDTCAGCHQNAQMMGKYGISIDIVDDYIGGEHGQGLLGEKNMSFPTCATCHGNHGYTPPGFSEVANVCGNCHTATRNYYLNSAHASAEDMNCASCHDSHVCATTAENFFQNPESGCRRCHQGDEPEIDNFIDKLLVESTENARLSISEAEEDVDKAVKAGFYVDREMASIWEARAALTEFGIIQHSLDQNLVDKILRESASKAQHASEEISEKFKGMYGRNALGMGLAAFFLFLLLAVYLKYLSLKKALITEKQKADRE